MEKKTRVVPISFSKQYTKELEHLKSQENVSAYVCNLIRKDLQGAIDEEMLERKISEILKKMRVGDSTPPKPKTNKLKSLINM